MMSSHRGGWIIILTFAVAMGLHVLPWPNDLKLYLPNWSLLVLFYWCIATPQRVGVGYGWLLGLFMDVLSGTVLGQNALIYGLAAYLSLQLYSRLRNFPAWQQALIILLFLLLAQVMNLWISGMQGASPEKLDFWMPSLVGGAIWPLVLHGLRLTRRRFKVQ